MRKLFSVVIFSCLLLLASCYLPSKVNPESSSGVQTSVAQTVQVRQTQGAFETMVATLTAQPTQALGTEDLTPTVTTPTNPSITPTPIPTPCDWASLVEDVSIPDGTLMVPGQSFMKTWRLKNIGTCTWTPDYSIVFIEGSSLSAPASMYINETVYPQDTIDISVSMIAPNAAGSYTSNWLLKNSTGNTFGLGSSGQAYFWAKITVNQQATLDASNPLDFAHNVCAAVWNSSAGALPCPGSGSDFTNGSITVQNSPKLEGGYQEDETAIIMIPANGSNGYITGRFPAITIQNGDHLKSLIGCLDKSPNCNVLFQLSYVANGGPITALGGWNEVSEGSFTNIDIDLSSLTGKSIEFIFTVQNNGTSTDDRAFWVAPHVHR
jgi:hypothetical protein